MRWLQVTARVLSEMNCVSVAFRLLLAVLVGGLIGLERGRTGHAAGLRTHILVAVGSAMTVMLGQYSVDVLGYNGDPMRVSAQVISGIGFLGAGQIMTRSRSQVTGLTTAAGLWATASIGLAIGIGFYWAGVVAFFAVKLTITMLPRIEVNQRKKSAEICGFYLEINDALQVKRLVGTLTELGGELRIQSPKSGRKGNLAFMVSVEPGEQEKISNALSEFDCVEFVVPEIE